MSCRRSCLTPTKCGGAGVPPAFSSRAFTLIEVGIVIIVVGLIAATAIPAMDSLTDTRRIAALREIERRLGIARAAAITTGQPTGLVVGFSDDSFQYVNIPTFGSAPMPIITPGGEPDKPFSLAEEFAGVETTSVIAGDGSSGDTIIWFSFEGVPQTRTAAGTLTGGFTQDASIQVTGGGTVYIRRFSGLIER